MIPFQTFSDSKGVYIFSHSCSTELTTGHSSGMGDTLMSIYSLPNLIALMFCRKNKEINVNYQQC